jgi:hypothetical protein
VADESCHSLFQARKSMVDDIARVYPEENLKEKSRVNTSGKSRAN